MKSILICPGERPTMGFLTEHLPLACAPLLGQSLVEYWLSHLACAGVKQVTLLVNHHPDLLHELVGHGTRWGLAIDLKVESRELTAAEAMLKHVKQIGPEASSNGIVLLDHFPGLEQYPLFQSYAGWFAGLRAWLPQARTPDRVGPREIRPGIWADMHARVSPSAQLEPPAWLGRNVVVGPRSRIGPGALIEDGSLVEADAEVFESYVARDTLVGQGTELKHSLALGSTLLNWQTGSAVQVPDAFVLCALRRPAPGRPASWVQRVAELLTGNKSQDELFWKDLLINKEG